MERKETSQGTRMPKEWLLAHQESDIARMKEMDAIGGRSVNETSKDSLS